MVGTGIEWANHTWNPMRGCEKVSPACTNCYAERDSFKNPGTLGQWGGEAAGGTRIVASEKRWADPFTWDKWGRDGTCFACGGRGYHKTQKCPHCNMTGRLPAGPYRPRVFCASIADFFEDWRGPVQDHFGARMYHGTPASGLRWHPNPCNQDPSRRPVTYDDIRARAFGVMAACRQIDWLVLTKRPENVERMAPQERGNTGHLHPKLPGNVWLGTTIENGDYYERLKHLLNVPATLHWVSVEPMLGAVSFSEIPFDFCDGCGSQITMNAYRATITCECCVEGPESLAQGKLGWVIAGGESGARARPTHPLWAEWLRAECVFEDCPFFWKQWGEWCPLKPADNIDWKNMRLSAAGDDVSDTPGLWQDADAEMFRVGRRSAGKLLGGQEWTQYPSVEATLAT